MGYQQASFAFDPPAVSVADEPGPDLASYDCFIVAFSGGKDSIALVAHLLERGVPREKIELWHHDVDGDGRLFMDWACTAAYCRAVADALGLPLYFSYRIGGIEGEVMKVNARSAGIRYEVPEGGWREAGGERGKIGTRLNWPAKGADLITRWCSGLAKIDVMSMAIRQQDRFLGRRLCVLTGERAEESKNRAKYKVFEPDRTHTNSRHVDRWRAVLRWSEQEVWDAMQRLGIVPHPGYRLGWGRLSCLTCIFGSPDQWATIQAVFPDRFALIAGREDEIGKTINFDGKRPIGVREIAARGRPYPAALAQPELVAVASSHEWIGGSVLVDPADWTLPAGAFGEASGPS